MYIVSFYHIFVVDCEFNSVIVQLFMFTCLFGL